MELANIEKLIEKYLEAETSLQEENILRTYFTSGNVAPHLEDYAIMFGYFKQNQSETFTKTIKLKPEKKSKKNFKWLSVAASLALLVSVYVGKVQYDKYQQRVYFAQVKEALEKVSFQLNKGNDALYAVSDNLNKGSDAVSQLKIYENTANTVLKKVNY
ncbi:hypothetical protein EV195_105213 [Tenacibaculum skagerrakense]|uniref:Uncharacterized protein n=1 Tax=Tenacibaculum skagerrakense TaxID=186571 RepID=A0A4R2NSM4_9FLAO|nr:hypothetical protein [Tenacibaculum skagerrakense]TCP24782.1 hypothetical protein EV195_105213 [Tenacibaculum skagerrakense]